MNALRPGPGRAGSRRTALGLGVLVLAGPVLAALPPTDASLATAGQTLAAAVPDSATHHYRARARYRGFELSGTAHLQWRQDGQAYDARLEITSWLRLLRVQHSTGRITAQGLAPERFSDRRRSEEVARFEHEGGRITFSPDRPAAALEPGAQDRLSVLLQVGTLMAAAPQRHAPGSVLRLQVAGTRDAADWAFRVQQPQTLRLPGGVVQTVQLLRAAQRPHEPTLQLWLGPGQAYAPVRLRLTEPDGDWLELQWSGTDKG